MKRILVTVRLELHPLPSSADAVHDAVTEFLATTGKHSTRQEYEREVEAS